MLHSHPDCELDQRGEGEHPVHYDHHCDLYHRGEGEHPLHHDHRCEQDQWREGECPMQHLISHCERKHGRFFCYSHGLNS